MKLENPFRLCVEVNDSEALEAYPWLADPDAQGTRAIETMLEKYPCLAQIPRARLAVADMLIGANLRMRLAAAVRGKQCEQSALDDESGIFTRRS